MEEGREERRTKGGFCEFKPSLVYGVSSRPASEILTLKEKAIE